MNPLAQRVRDILNNNLYITMATASNGQPWNTPVYAIHDNRYDFYWISWVYAQHSQNIRRNENVFIVVYDTTRAYGTNHQRCVYVQAKAHELNDEAEIAEALKQFHIPNKETSSSNELCGDSVRRLYKATPQRIWLNDKAESQLTKDDTEMRVEVPIGYLL